MLGRNLLGLFAIVLYGAIVFWTYRDAERRGAMGWFWALVTLIFFPFFPYPGWIIYLIARPAESVDDVHERELEIRAKEAAARPRLRSLPGVLQAGREGLPHLPVVHEEAAQVLRRMRPCAQASLDRLPVLQDQAVEPYRRVAGDPLRPAVCGAVAFTRRSDPKCLRSPSACPMAPPSPCPKARPSSASPRRSARAWPKRRSPARSTATSST